MVELPEKYLNQMERLLAVFEKLLEVLMAALLPQKEEEASPTEGEDENPGEEENPAASAQEKPPGPTPKAPHPPKIMYYLLRQD